eukprot:4250873-Alexandrium_andersonii.AAC.1
MPTSTTAAEGLSAHAPPYTPTDKAIAHAYGALMWRTGIPAAQGQRPRKARLLPTILEEPDEHSPVAELGPNAGRAAPGTAATSRATPSSCSSAAPCTVPTTATSATSVTSRTTATLFSAPAAPRTRAASAPMTARTLARRRGLAPPLPPAATPRSTLAEALAG